MPALNGNKNYSLKNNNVFKKLESLHMELRKFAKEATIAYNNKEITNAKHCLKEMDKWSVKVSNILDEIKEYLKCYK